MIAALGLLALLAHVWGDRRLAARGGRVLDQQPDVGGRPAMAAPVVFSGAAFVLLAAEVGHVW